MISATNIGSDHACEYAQSNQSLCKSLEYYMNVQLLAEQHLEFLSLKGGCTCRSESTLVKMPHCWKSHLVSVSMCLSLKRRSAVARKTDKILH